MEKGSGRRAKKTSLKLAHTYSSALVHVLYITRLRCTTQQGGPQFPANNPTKTTTTTTTTATYSYIQKERTEQQQHSYETENVGLVLLLVVVVTCNKQLNKRKECSFADRCADLGRFGPGFHRGSRGAGGRVGCAQHIKRGNRRLT